MPSIWFLALEDAATNIWPILLIGDGKERLLPRLCELRHTLRELPTELVELVESRWWPGDCNERVEEGVVAQRLQSVYLDMWGGRIKRSSMRRLVKCQEEGLDLDIEIEGGFNSSNDR